MRAMHSKRKAEETMKISTKQTIKDITELVLMGTVVYFMGHGGDNLTFLILVNLFLRQGKIMVTLKKEQENEAR